MIHIVRGQLLQIFVEILKKSASSLIDTVVVYYLKPATFGRQLKSGLFSVESKVNQGGLGLFLLSGCEHGGDRAAFEEVCGQGWLPRHGC